MPRSTSVSFDHEVYDDQDNLITLRIEATCHPGKSANMNYGGLPDPPEPPRAEMDDITVVDTPDNIDPDDVDTEELYCKAEDAIHEKALERASTRSREASRGKPYNHDEHRRR